MSSSSQQLDPLETASLPLGITFAALVFGIGLCAWTFATFSIFPLYFS